MKGFEIYYNEKKIEVVCDDFLAIIFCVTKENAFCNVTGSNYTANERSVWLNQTINPGDKFSIKMTEVNRPSVPMKVDKDKNIKRQKTKLEFFREFEENLKKEGLL